MGRGGGAPLNRIFLAHQPHLIRRGFRLLGIFPRSLEFLEANSLPELVFLEANSLTKMLFLEAYSLTKMLFLEANSLPEMLFL